MANNAVLEEILATRTVRDEAGNTHELREEIDEGERELITSIIVNHGFTRAVEVGCAFGISSLCIAGALARGSDPQFTVIDPNQQVSYHGVGFANLRRAGFDFCELIERRSEIALPALLEQGRTYQFAFIDGYHSFDQGMVDFYFCDQLLEIGGVVAFDDVSWPTIRRVVRYVLRNFPHYELVATNNWVPPGRKTLKRRIFDHAMRAIHAAVPAHYSEGTFADPFQLPDHEMGINASMVGLRKSGPDKRHWTWHRDHFASF